MTDPTCDENNPECRCEDCVNAGSDLADMDGGPGHA